jgi:Flp pilus assembly protein TadG
MTLRRTRRRSHRRGAATVELAITLPLLLMVVFGGIEICQRIFLRQSAAIAAYEGARLAARRTTDAAEVIERVEQIMVDRNVTGATVETIPSDLSAVDVGDQVTVRIRIPYPQNTPSSFVLSGTGDLELTTTMLRE